MTDTSEPLGPTDRFATLFGTRRGGKNEAATTGLTRQEIPRTRHLMLMANHLHDGQFEAVHAQLADRPCSSHLDCAGLGLLCCALAERLSRETRALLVWASEAYMLGEVHPERAAGLIDEALCGALHTVLRPVEQECVWTLARRAQRSVVLDGLIFIESSRRLEWLHTVLGERLPALRASMLAAPDVCEADVDLFLEYGCLAAVIDITLPASVGEPVDWPRFIALVEDTMRAQTAAHMAPF